MSKLTRMAIALVISLVIVAGVYFSVQALSVVARQESLGMYMLNGSLVNPLQQEAVEESSQPELQTYPDPSGEGKGDCDRKKDNSSDL